MWWLSDRRGTWSEIEQHHVSPWVDPCSVIVLEEHLDVPQVRQVCEIIESTRLGTLALVEYTTCPSEVFHLKSTLLLDLLDPEYSSRVDKLNQVVFMILQANSKGHHVKVQFSEIDVWELDGIPEFDFDNTRLV